MSDKNEQSEVMRDYAASDPRSARAWLNGSGDGRNEKFAEFAKRKGREAGSEVHYEYMEHVRKTEGYNPDSLVEDLAAMNVKANKPGLFGRFVVPVLGLAAGVMLVQMYST